LKIEDLEILDLAYRNIENSRFGLPNIKNSGLLPLQILSLSHRISNKQRCLPFANICTASGDI